MESFATWNNNSFPFEPTFTMPISGFHYAVPSFEPYAAFSLQKTFTDESLPSSKRIRSGLSSYVPICHSTSMAKAQQQLPVLNHDKHNVILDSSNPPACTNPLWSGTISIDNCIHSRLDLQVTGFNTSSNSQLFRFFESNPQANCNLWPSSLYVYAFCSTSRLHLFRKNALGILCLCPDTASSHNYDMFLYHLTATGTIAVIELAENTLFLVPFRQERIYAVLLHKVVDVSHFFPRGMYSLSIKYHREGRLSDRMMDGFYDPGRVGEILEIEEYQNMKVDPMTREVLLVDSNVDAKLAATVKRAEEFIHAFSDLETKARVLALFVSNVFGGDFPSTQSSSQEISALKILRNSNIIPIGEITRGVCRHRSILYKYLCDRVSIPCELRRGNYAGSTSTGAHSWNIIKLGMSHYVVDIMHEPTQLYTVDSQKAKNYMRVTHIDGEVQYVTENVRNKTELSEKRFLKVPQVMHDVVVHEKLGRGGYGSVHRVTVGGLTCAMKKIDLVKLSEKQREYALQEVAVMEKFNHKNIVHYLGHESNSDISEIRIFMELFPFSLGQLIERRRKHNQAFSISEISEIAMHVLRGMEYLHSEMQILHRDLKSDNILVDLDEQGKINKVKLTDFGVCKYIRKLPDDMTRVGTELFLAPEVHTMTQYSVASDVFSFGMILVELVTLAPPFAGLTKSTAITYIKNGKMPELPQKENLRKIISIVNSCLRVEPELRPSPKLLLIELNKT